MKSLFDEPEVCTVSQLTARIKELLEGGFSSLWVTGEVCNCTKASSGHIYLSLKDKDAVVRSVIWRSTAVRLQIDLQEGLEVLARGRISVYAPRGDYQLVIDEIQAKGLGAQDIALKKLKEKLARLGYFAAERKRPLPLFPRRIAIVTSPSGAAIRDMLEILCRRWPVAEIWVCPVRVQGPGAAGEIAQALRRISGAHGVDVILLGRGGGSSEDLAAFNDEAVAKAIFEARVPVISAVGHEIDVTIADLVADRRALTPSEAAELATPDRMQLVKELETRANRMRSLLASRWDALRRRLDDLAGRRVLAQPFDRLREQERRLDDWDARMQRAFGQRLVHARHGADKLAGRLHTLSPLNVLGRGYSLTRTLPERALVRSITQAVAGATIETVVGDGRIVSRIEDIQPNE